MFYKKRKTPVVRYTNENGLTNQQVKERQLQKLVNKREIKTTKSYTAIILKNVFTLFNLLWFAIAAVLIYIGAYQDCFFLIIIIANLLIGIIQEVKAKKTVEKLSLFTAPTAIVLRENHEAEIPATNVVLDDVIKLYTGKEICCDSIVISGSIEVNEALLTGESVPVKKTAGSSIFAGSFVSSGNCLAKVEHVGNDNYIQQLAKKAKKLKDPLSELLKSLKFLINIIAVLIVPLTTIVYFRNKHIFGEDIFKIITKSSGAIVGMIPSGMFLLTSMALAVGIIRLAKRRTLVQDLYCIEMLARTTTLCLDKTGTITDGTMVVIESIPLAENAKPVEEIISSILNATNDKNHTAIALYNAYGNAVKYDAVTTLPFSSSRKLSAATFAGLGTYAVGAGEFMFDELSEDLKDLIKIKSLEGYRVLCVGYSKQGIENDSLPRDLSPQYLILLEDHIRENAEETIKWFYDNGVKIKIISGDNPVSVFKIAQKAGVVDAEKYISLDNMTDIEVQEAAKTYTVFGRVTPDQKALLIKSLKAYGETVAMTGDGVNDILAMKEADCSIAMAAGSEAARNVANLTLLDSDFSCMPKVVAEGRRVINNITKTSSMYLMKTFFVIMLVALLSLFPVQRFNFNYPFSPKQMMLLEIMVIGIPSFFLALQPNENRIKGRFLISVFKKSVPAALVLVLNILFLFNFTNIFGEQLGIDYNAVVTMSIYSVTFTGFLILGIICYKFNKYRAIMFFTMLALTILFIIFMPGLFELSALSTQMYMIVAGLLVVNLPLLLLLLKIADKLKI